MASSSSTGDWIIPTCRRIISENNCIKRFYKISLPIFFIEFCTYRAHTHITLHFERLKTVLFSCHIHIPVPRTEKNGSGATYFYDSGYSSGYSNFCSHSHAGKPLFLFLLLLILLLLLLLLLSLIFLNVLKKQKLRKYQVSRSL